MSTPWLPSAPAPLQRPRLVIFDCDGVLVDSEPLAARTLAAFITELGRPTESDECLEAFTGISLGRVREIIEGDWGTPLPADFTRQLAARDRAAFSRALKPVAGARETVARLKAAGIQVCVASSGRLEKMDFTLGLCGLKAVFEGHLFSAEQVAHGKPAPDLFLLAARELHTRPGHALVIEDSPAGVRAAIAADMAVLGFCGGGHMTAARARALASAGATTQFTELAALPALLGVQDSPARG